MNIRLRAVELSDANLIYEWENSFPLWEVSSTRDTAIDNPHKH